MARGVTDFLFFLLEAGSSAAGRGIELLAQLIASLPEISSGPGAALAVIDATVTPVFADRLEDDTVVFLFPVKTSAAGSVERTGGRRQRADVNYR